MRYLQELGHSAGVQEGLGLRLNQRARTGLSVNDTLKNVGLRLNTNLGDNIGGESTNLSANKRRAVLGAREEMVDHLQELRNILLQCVEASVGSGIISVSSANLALGI